MKKIKQIQGLLCKRGSISGVEPSFHSHLGPSALPRAGYLSTCMLFEFSIHNPLEFTMKNNYLRVGDLEETNVGEEWHLAAGKQLREGQQSLQGRRRV